MILTTEKVLGVETLLPQEKVLPDTAHLPLLVDNVRLEVVPESVNVAGVWADKVPAVRIPPTFAPDWLPLSVLFEGSWPGVCHIH